MTSLLEVGLTLIGIVLILALAAESLQELLKAAFALKGHATLQAVERLVKEAAVTENQPETDAEEIVKAIRARLRALGQPGIRPRAVRLDAISVDKLAELIQSVSPDDVTSLRKLDKDAARERLHRIATRAAVWYPLAISPVDDRYRRRMRGYALLSSAVVVLAVNADAFQILQRARQDAQFRERVNSAVQSLDSLRQARAVTSATADSITAAPDTAVAGGAAPSDSAGAVLARALSDDFLFNGFGGWRPKSYTWWIGILLSIALVSLGAPFWHDMLEALFGLKSRLRAQVRNLEHQTPGPAPIIVMPPVAIPPGAVVPRPALPPPSGDVKT